MPIAVSVFQGGPVSFGAIALVAAASLCAAAGAVCLRRWLPVGMPLGMAIAAVSVSVCSIGPWLLAVRGLDIGAAHLTAVLAVASYVVGAAMHRGSARSPVAQSALVFLAAAVALALLTVVQALRQPGDARAHSVVAIDLGGFFLVSAARALVLRRSADWIVCLACAVSFLAFLFAGTLAALDRYASPGSALLAGSVAALVSIAPVMSDWFRRRRVWLAEPERLLEARAHWPVADLAALAFSIVAGVLAFSEADVPFALAPAGLAAMASGAVAHRWTKPGLAGALCLFFCVETAVLLCTAAVSTGPFGLLAGLALGTLWVMWLARFWEQQLLDGRAWTTSGRLIPIARSVAGLAAAAVFCVAWSDPLRSSSEAVWAVGAGGGCALAFLALLVFLAYRDVRDGHSFSEITACLALFSASKVAAILFFLFVGRESGVLSLLAVAATVIALVAVTLGSGTRLPVSTSVAGGLFPMLIAFSLAERTEPLRLLAPSAIAAGVIVVLWMVQRGPRMPRRAADI